MLAKVVYHKLADPDHKKLRTHVADGVLRHVNNGYCSLLEPKSISGGQFAEWITGRNPGTYVAVHYLKLIDFTFGPDWRLDRVSATGQRGLVGPADGPTWDSVQLQVVYTHPDGREAAFDIHTSWVTPDNFPGYVEQEVQFRFDNGVWNAHQRKRGVEVTRRGPHARANSRTPRTTTTTARSSNRGASGRSAATASKSSRGSSRRWRPSSSAARRPSGRTGSGAARALTYNDLVGRPELRRRSCRRWKRSWPRTPAGDPGCSVEVNGPRAGLSCTCPGGASRSVLYPGRV